jgi:AraC-type DNA-binding domain-containing proteins
MSIMFAPVRPASAAAPLYSSSVFAGPHVQLDEARWSPAFEAQLSSWTSTPSMLIVTESGAAMASVPGVVPSSGQARADAQARPLVAAAATRMRPMERCAVFRFDANAVSSALSGVPVGFASMLARLQRAEPGLVQVSPSALFRYYWRRHAIALAYPSPDEHVEEDAKALWRHVVSRARSTVGSDDISQGRLRHRALAQKAQSLMARAIADPHPISQMARALDTSPFHLAHVFRTEVGSSPHQYLVQLRLIAALVQLRAGAPDLSKLALELGFCHHSHFTAVFRQALGYTPRQVRRMLTTDSIADLGIAVRRCS